jgi:hypothetical protein
MLARMNFAATLATNQKFNLAREAVGYHTTPERLLAFFTQDRLSPPVFERGPNDELLAYLRAGGAWTGNTAQLSLKAPGLARLIIGSAEYQFV